MVHSRRFSYVTTISRRDAPVGQEPHILLLSGIPYNFRVTIIPRGDAPVGQEPHILLLSGIPYNFRMTLKFQLRTDWHQTAAAILLDENMYFLYS
jgi:hypothetical protein